jgi:hypothetical protein
VISDVCTASVHPDDELDLQMEESINSMLLSSCLRRRAGPCGHKQKPPHHVFRERVMCDCDSTSCWYIGMRLEFVPFCRCFFCVCGGIA